MGSLVLNEATIGSSYDDTSISNQEMHALNGNIVIVETASDEVTDG